MSHTHSCDDFIMPAWLDLSEITPCGPDCTDGDDVDPSYYCGEGRAWSEHTREAEEDREVRAAEERIEDGQRRWSETGSSRRR